MTSTTRSLIAKLDAGAMAGTTYGPLHRSNQPELRAALDQLPGYRKALEHLNAIAAVKRPGTAAADPRPVIDLVLDAIEAGDEVPPPAALQLLAEQETTRRTAETLAGVLDTAKVTLVARLDGALETGVPAICRLLTARVVDIVEQARALSAVPGTAEEAIEAGAVEDWRKLDGIATGYAAVREAQELLWNHFSSRGRRLGEMRTHAPGMAPLAWVRNAHELDPAILESNAGRGHRLDGFATAKHAELWPADWHATSTVWWYREHPDAEPWAPSAEDFEKRKAEVTEELLTQHAQAGRGARQTAIVGAR